MQRLPAGTWPSPLTAASLVGGATAIGGLMPDGDAVWWAEQRPDEGGRTVIVRWHAGTAVEVTPPTANVRTRVHEYGGGAWCAHDGRLYYSDFADSRLRRLDVSIDGAPGEPVLLTPEPERPHAWRYADGRPTPDGRWYVCVRERHEPSGEPANELVAVATDGSGDVRLVDKGPDFYASPRLHPDGIHLAWIQWDHPNMPWDATELWLGELVDGVAVGARRLAGNGDEALMQPEWTADGQLLVVTDRTDWWNVHRVDLDTGELTRVAGGAYDITHPHWVFDAPRYAAGFDGVAAHVVGDPAGARLDVGGVEVDTGCTSIDDVRAAADGSVLFVGASFQSETSVIRVAGAGDGAALTVETLRPARRLPFDLAFLPDPELIEFATPGGGTAYGLFYAPAHPDVKLPDGELPPVVVTIHGGPTSQARRMFNATHRYWTSRGIAVVDVDYRGSSGYGRAYRNLLCGNWCVTDVEDAVAAVDHLVAAGRVDGNRAVIRGGSSGGSTTLLALATTDRFATGANYFGVADLAALVTDDHKFESRYTVGLIGPYPEAADVYTARSPLAHADSIDVPLIVFQGLDDMVVPPAHSERIVDAVHARGLPVGYVPFEGEGHGFRRAENVIRSLEAELWFFGHVLGFTPADEIAPVPLTGR
ncbi:MAG TPA: prolyl oligopeptidase family serine peptidase [Ilumatobacter sp.]|nr:prolyl oligopeptidase family serine peptidase [Ilumatobacter sp.]